VQPGAARWDGRQGGRGVRARRRPAHAHLLVHVLVERAGTQTPATTTASTQAAALCGDLWSIPAPWQARGGSSTDRERGDDTPSLVVADGAKWIKTEQARHFPQATCILDWAHLWREVGGAIRAAARAKPLSQRERDYQLYLHRSWLWHGGVDQALQGLRTLGAGLPAEPLETITKAITYLENQRPWIGSYEHWRKLGYPVGSGMIERAVAW